LVSEADAIDSSNKAFNPIASPTGLVGDLIRLLMN